MIKSLDIGKKRNSSIELLRIIAIELIVAWHYCTQFNSTGGGCNFDHKSISISYLCDRIWYMGAIRSRFVHNY